MKIAVSADGPDLDSEVASRLGTSEYLLIIDLEDGGYEAVPNPAQIGQRGAGVQAVVLMVDRGAEAILTGHCSPALAGQLAANGIEIRTGITGKVSEAVRHYRETRPDIVKAGGGRRSFVPSMPDRAVLVNAVRTASRQFLMLLPSLAGVVLLIGLFDEFVSREVLTAIFSGNRVLDTLWGACFGSIFAGNPVNSYIIGGELLTYGVSLYAVTAFVVTWVTVGLVQLPAEMAALGRRFALLRNGLSFLLAMPVAVLTVLIVDLITGGAR